jgi:DHA2 family multidrug resistance protein-like MFS transporter
LIDPTARARLFALTSTSLGTFVTTLSGQIVNTALPTIAHDFGITAAQSVWAVNGLQLATTATLLTFASIGDARGAKRLYLSGLVVFTLATIGCALAPSFPLLVIMRVLQGLGGSALIVTTNALNRALFPSAMLGRSVAVNSIFVAVGTAAGPTLGGLVLAFGPWPWIFWINVPLALVAFALGVRYLPDLPGNGSRIDYRSALQAAIGFGAIIYALDGIARHDPPFETAIVATAGIVAMALFIRRQFRLDVPMLAVELFRVPIFGVAVAASSATYVAQGLAYVSLPFFFQSVLGRTPLQSGLLLSAWPVMALLVALRIGRLSDRYSASLLCTVGILVMGLGLAGFALLPAQPSTFAIVACAAIGGLGFATFQTPNNRAIIAAAPPEKTGRAAGVMATARLSGQTTGAALVAIVFELTAATTGGGASVGRATTEAALVVACAFIAFAAILSSVRWRASAQAA